MHENHKIDAQEAKKTKKEETKQFIRWCIPGAVGGAFSITLTIHIWVAAMAWFAGYLGPRIGAELRTAPGGHAGFIVRAERYLDLMETFFQRNGI
ncbi:hypothetical protein ACSNNV_07305 [Faecalibacterium prausnitzii]|uniref:hypothetical protein n=1 Tax=Faecalibacterium prausnitzii TaxID=853 RepID=UPI001AD80227|nr:hypothetical protein [Faecalibacterium prausnitzii]